jgi:hypothetical protein
MKKDIIWGSIPIIGLEDDNYNKFPISQLAKIENGINAGKIAIKTGLLKSISKKGGNTPKPKGFGEKITKIQLGKKHTEERKKNQSLSAKKRKKPFEKTLENPKAQIILKLLKEGLGTNEIIRQSNCSNGFYYKIKTYFDGGQLKKIDMVNNHPQKNKKLTEEQKLKIKNGIKNKNYPPNI